MDDLTERLARLAPEAPADAALAAIRADAVRHRRQRTALVAMVAVLALIAGTTVLLGGGGDEGAVDPVDDEVVVDDGELVPAVFDGSPRLEPVRALPDCDRHDDLEAWATSILDVDFADYPQAGPMPEGPMEPAPLNDVAATAPVLLATDDGSPAVCITALAGPNELVAWEQRDDRGALIARGAAAPWASNLMPDLGGPAPELQDEIEAARMSLGGDELIGSIGDRLVGARPSIAGRGLSNGAAYPVRVDGAIGVALATANWDVRLQVEVLQPDAVTWDAQQVSLPNDLVIEHPLSHYVLAGPGVAGEALQQRLVWTRRGGSGSRSLDLLVPAGWVWCGQTAESLPGDLEPSPRTLLCGPDGERATYYSGAPVQDGDRHTTESGLRIVVGPVADGRRQLSATYQAPGDGGLVDETQSLDLPASVSVRTALAMLERLPSVAAGPPVELPVADGPAEAPPLGRVSDVLDGMGSPLADLQFTWLYQDGREGDPDLLPQDLRQIEATVRGEVDRTVAINVWVPPHNEPWHLRADSSAQPASTGSRGHVIVIEPHPEGAQEVGATTRCGAWELTLRTPRRDGGPAIAVRLLADLADAFGCIPTSTP